MLTSEFKTPGGRVWKASSVGANIVNGPSITVYYYHDLLMTYKIFIAIPLSRWFASPATLRAVTRVENLPLLTRVLTMLFLTGANLVDEESIEIVFDTDK